MKKKRFRKKKRKKQFPAIDGYALLHRIATRNPLALWNIEYLAFFKNYNITPIFVFDGCNLPAKQLTEHQREEKRQTALTLANKLKKEGKVNDAMNNYKKAIDITPYHASIVIKTLKSKKVECIVVPFEADAQLAFLSRTEYVDVVICEDSDMIPYGCSTVLFKLNIQNGSVDVYRARNLKESLFGENITLFQIQIICIVAGCDYCEGLSGIGVKKSNTMLNSYALLTFNHQYVYDPDELKVVPLTSFEEFDDMNDIKRVLGIPPQPEIAQKIANGEYDPTSQKPFEKRIYSLQQNKFVARTQTKTSPFVLTKQSIRETKIKKPIDKKEPFDSSQILKELNDEFYVEVLSDDIPNVTKTTESTSNTVDLENDIQQPIHQNTTPLFQSIVIDDDDDNEEIHEFQPIGRAVEILSSDSEETTPSSCFIGTKRLTLSLHPKPKRPYTDSTKTD
ncbi:Exonuclease 1 [Entamoeba marina]